MSCKENTCPILCMCLRLSSASGPGYPGQKHKDQVCRGLQGEELGHVVSSPGTKSVGLGWGKLLPLSYFITLTVASYSSYDRSRESLVWVRHAVGKAESYFANEQFKTTQLSCHNISQAVTSFKLRIVLCPPNTGPEL